MRKELDLDRAIAEIARRLKAHIASNGNAHLPVTTDANGFMTTDMLKEHNTVFKQRTAVQDPAGTDILKLPVGYYSGSSFINHPRSGKPTDINTAHSYISVIPSSQTSRRLIVLVEATTGAIWTRTVNDMYETNNRWAKVEQPEILWSGSSLLDDPVTLAAPVYNDDGGIYSSIRVTFQGAGLGHGYGSRYGVNVQSVNPHDVQGVIYTSVDEAKIRFPTPTTAQVTTRTGHIYKTKSDTDNSLEAIPKDPDLIITEIAGIR